MGLYVAADGSYGDAEGIAIINDADWTQFEYDLLDTNPSMNLADFAEGIDAWIKKGRPLFTRVGGYHFEMDNLHEVAEAIALWWSAENGTIENPVVTL
jgi:hypothetical protein